MPNVKHIVHYVKTYGLAQKPVYLLSLMILFWALYEGIVSYIAPIIITNKGFSETEMGIIIGSSSIAGAFFDFIACRIFKNTYYKRMFLLMFIICLFYPLVLFQANSFVIYLIAMSMWGVYYDLKNIGSFDYISRHTSKNEFSDSFGLTQAFMSIGLIISPILVGIFVADTLDWKPIVTSWVFLGMSFFFFITLSLISKNKQPLSDERVTNKRGIFSEIKLWGKMGQVLLPVLVLTLFLNLIDAFFWTVGPLYAEDITSASKFSGFFMTAYLFPALIVGWVIGIFTGRYGKKKTAFFSLLFGGMIMFLLRYTDNMIATVCLIFASSIFISMSWPAINGAYADYISENNKLEKEIEGLEDFYTNIGYIIGPMLAGYLSDQLGHANAFSMLGASGVLLSLLLITLTPSRISLNKLNEMTLKET